MWLPLPGLGRTAEEENTLPGDTVRPAEHSVPPVTGWRSWKSRAALLGLSSLPGWVLGECRWAGSGQAAPRAHLCLIAGEDEPFPCSWGLGELGDRDGAAGNSTGFTNHCRYKKEINRNQRGFPRG